MVVSFYWLCAICKIPEEYILNQYRKKCITITRNAIYVQSIVQGEAEIIAYQNNTSVQKSLFVANTIPWALNVQI